MQVNDLRVAVPIKCKRETAENAGKAEVYQP